MSFLGGWKDALVGAGGSIGHGFGAVMDWALDDNNGIDPKTGQSNPSEWSKMLGDVQKAFHGVYEGAGPLGVGAKWLMEKDYALYSHYISHPSSRVITAASLADSPIWQQQQHRNQISALFDTDTWKRAGQIADHRSPGQAFALMATDDILDEHEVQDYQRNWWFTLLSGGFDAVWSMRFDPLGAVGKGAKLSGINRTTKPLPTTLTEMGASKEVQSATKATDLTPIGEGVTPSGEDAFWPPKPAAKSIRSSVEERTPMVRTLDWMQKVSERSRNPGEAARIIAKHPMLAESQHAGLIGTMMATSTRGEKDLIMRAAMNDGSAYMELDATRKDLARQLQQLEDVRDDLPKAEFTLSSATTKAFDPDRLKAVDDEIGALESRRKWIDDLIGPDGAPKSGVFGSVGREVKGLGYDKIAAAGATARGTVDRFAARGGALQAVHYYNSYNTPLRVIAGVGMGAVGKASHFVNGARPRGVLDTNDPEGWRELDSTLARVKGFSPERRSEIIGKYMRSTSDGAKLQIATNAEREAMNHIMARVGLKAEDAGKVIDEHFLQRDRSMAMIKNRAYASTKGVDGVRIDFVDSENVANAVLPVFATQLADKIPLTDMDRLQTAVARHKNALKATFGKNVRDPAVNLADILSSVWKTSTLMRFGYLVRVVGDDELAYIAKLGAMTALKPVGEGASNWAYNRFMTNKLRVQRGVHRNVEAFKTGKSAREINETLPKELRTFEKREIGKGSEDVTLDGKTMTVQKFAPEGKVGEYWRAQASDDRTVMEMDANSRLRDMRRSLAHGHGLTNLGDENYYPAWSRALNLQLGQDELGKRLLKGESEEDVVKWLKRDPGGRAHAARLPFRSADPERWVANVNHFVHELAPTEKLRTAARNGEITEKLIREELPIAEHPQQIAGGILDLNMGRGPIAETASRIRDEFYKRANQMPTDVLVRHPLADNLYNNRRNELIQRFTASGGQLDNSILRKLENSARSFTVKEVHKVVLDLSTHSNAAHVLRFVAPFYNAWDKALRRWGRMSYGDPSIIFKGNRLWQGIGNMPLAMDPAAHVEDAEGNRIEGTRGLSNSGEQLITFRLPETIAKKIGARILDQVQIPAGGMNLVLQGNQWYLPGFGPMVQIPANAFAIAKPGYSEMLKGILPFGPQKYSDLVTPTSVRKLGQWKGEDDQNFQALTINIWRTRCASWVEGGKVGPMPDPMDPQIQKDAHAMRRLQFFTQVFSPVNVRFTTPYKFYVDEYHRMLSDPAIGPEKARDLFIQKHPEYFLFAESVSKNNASLPATVEAWNASKKYKNLLAQTPDVAPVVMGDILGGQFNSAVYRAQFGQKLSPASTQTSREPQSLKDFAAKTVADQGWTHYNKYMELLRVELANRHLLSFAQKGAEDLQQIKQAAVAKISQENPQWAAQYASYDKEKQQSVMDQLHKVTTFKQVQSRPEIQTLNQYLYIRDLMLNELRRRDQAGGSASIVAVANQDLAQSWEYERDRIAESDPVFSRTIFDRYLASDTLVGI